MLYLYIAGLLFSMKDVQSLNKTKTENVTYARTEKKTTKLEFLYTCEDISNFAALLIYGNTI